MGRMKDLLPDYVWNMPEEEMNKFWLKQDVDAIVSQAKRNNNPVLLEFLDRVTPKAGPNYFIMVEDEAGTYINNKYNREEYINALCALSEEKYTLFYHIASFNDWADNENATATRCIYIDIDDIDINSNEADINDVKEFLKEKVKLTEEHFPDYAILSGHGIHACWLIDEMSAEDEHIRRRYVDSLITRIVGDFSGAPISHKFRCPCSYNLKDEVLKGKLFKLTDCNNTDIKRMDWCLLPSEMVNEYRRQYNIRVHAKGVETARKNKELALELQKRLGDTSAEEYLKRTDLSVKERSIAERLLKIQKNEHKEAIIQKYQDNEVTEDNDSDLYIFHEHSLPFDQLKPYDKYKKENRTWNLILDLHNFFIRHKGVLVSRNMYFTILAHLFKHKKESVRSAINWCKRYVDTEYYDEMVKIIEQAYSSSKTYRFSNERIAELLCFDETDINESYCNFSEERQKEAKKKRNQDYYTRKRNEAGKLSPKERQMLHLEYLKAHPEINDKDGMKALNVSRTTFYALKKMIEKPTVNDDFGSSKN